MSDEKENLLGKRHDHEQWDLMKRHEKERIELWDNQYLEFKKYKERIGGELDISKPTEMTARFDKQTETLKQKQAEEKNQLIKKQALERERETAPQKAISEETAASQEKTATHEKADSQEKLTPE